MDLSLSVESALVYGSDLVGMSVDWSNCFDRVPQRIAFQLAERQGLHTLECCNLCVACTVSCEEGLLWRDTWRRNLLPHTASLKVVL